MQSPIALTLIGLATVLVTVGLLIRSKVHPVIAMTLVPICGAVLAGYGLEGIGDFYSEGLKKVMSVTVMFIFAIIYFGVLFEAGLFNPLVKSLVLATRGNVVFVAVATALIGIVAHLDGAGATTFLLTIPALLPLYKAMKMSRYVLLAIISLAASVMNMVPWGGPVGRAATVVEADPDQLWRHLLPIQLVALVAVVFVAAGLGLREKRRITKLLPAGTAGHSLTNAELREIADKFEQTQAADRESAGLSLRRARWVTWVNVILTVSLLVILVGGFLPPAPAFLIATSLVLVVNFHSQEEQAAALKRHAPNALSMAGVILAAAMFLGVLNGSGMLEEMGLSLLKLVPESVGKYLHIIVGVFGVPLDLLTSTDAYYFSILPIVKQAAAAFGISGIGSASALIIGNVIGTFVSPFSPALWLGIGLAEANMGRHIRFSLPIAWVFSVVLVIIAALTGVLA